MNLPRHLRNVLLPSFSMYDNRTIRFVKDRNPAPQEHEVRIQMDMYVRWIQLQTPPPRIPVTPERVVHALRNDPSLMWAVLHHLREERVLAPWSDGGPAPWANGGRRNAWQERTDPKGCNIATVRREEYRVEQPWRWDIYDSAVGIPVFGWCDTAEEACAACDMRLIETGWMLA